MDIATIIGTLLGFSVVVGSIIMGGGAAMFFHIPSMAITIGGMLLAGLELLVLGTWMYMKSAL
ncbi:MAG: hypothetical protein JSW27_11270, partial [Phycisphaerales bacterium]